MLSTRNARALYSFPELKSAEILQCMEDLRVPLTDSELNKPTPAIVQRAYESFADIFMGVSRENYTQPNFAVMELLEYPDLHVDSISLVAFYRILLKLMIEVGIDDFSLRDLIRPEAPRFRIILSAVINFAKFREEQLGVFEEFTRKADEVVEERDRFLIKRQELQTRISAIKQRRQEEEPAVQKARQIITGLVQELRELKRNQTNLSTEIDQLKARRTDLSDKLSHTQFLVTSMKQECNKLKSRIVHSPEKLLQIISEMNANIATEKTNLTLLERKSRELQMKMEALAVVEQDITKSIQMMEANAVAIKKREEMQQAVQEEQEAIDKQQISNKDLAIKDQQWHRQLTSAQEKLARLHAQQQTKRDQIQVQLKALRQDYASVSEERAALMAKMDQTDKIVKEMETKLGELKRTHDAEMFNLRADCLTLKAQVTAYANELKKRL